MKYTFNLHSEGCNQNKWVSYTLMNMDYRAAVDLLKLYNRNDIGGFIIVPLIPNSQPSPRYLIPRDRRDYYG